MCLAEKYARTIICRSVVKKSVTFLAKSGVFGANEQQTAATSRYLRTDVCVQTFTFTLLSHDHISKIMAFTGAFPAAVRILCVAQRAFGYILISGLRFSSIFSCKRAYVRAVCIVNPTKCCGIAFFYYLYVYPSAHLRFRLGLGVLPLLFLYCFAI